jgi:hypothetical protein
MSFRLAVWAEGDAEGFRRVFQEGVTHVDNDGEQHRSLFHLDYLSGFIERAKEYELRIHMVTDFPLRVDWEGGTNGTWLLAPREDA